MNTCGRSLARTARRKFTGLKYWRITGRTAEKEPYRREWAMGAVDAHAGHFMAQRAQQIATLRGSMNIDPIIVSPFDAELFGHWWFEGPEWLEMFIRKAAYDQHEFTFATPSQYLESHDTAQLVVPSASSWGNKGYWEVWLNDANSWIYPHLHVAARRMSELAASRSTRRKTWRRCSIGRSARWRANFCSRNRATGRS